MTQFSAFHYCVLNICSKDEAEIVGADGHVYRGRFDTKSLAEPQVH